MTTIVIPMAGQSSRFYKAGYDVPKYKLKINNKSVFFHSLRSFLKFKDH
ncbi:capsular biosynthesis protein, partial [Escherichia coli]|nr:capsular biosynthesis protein [Escherichia coli]